nr:MAG TPA: hypothetical protein [Inoviridae sp.]
MPHYGTAVILALYSTDFERAYSLKQLCHRGCHVKINIALCNIVGLIDYSQQRQMYQRPVNIGLARLCNVFGFGVLPPARIMLCNKCTVGLFVPDGAFCIISHLYPPHRPEIKVSGGGLDQLIGDSSLSGRITYRIISDLFGGYLFIRLCGVHDLCTSTAGFGKADLVGLGKAQTVEIFRCTLRKIRIIRFGNLIAMKISSVKRVISISHSLHLRFACRILYRNCIDDFLNDCVLLACRPEVNAKFGGISF